MQRIKDEFIAKLTSALPLTGKDVLEIGCGEGTRSRELARHVGRLHGIDPDMARIREARRLSLSNAKFEQGNAESLEFSDTSFDIVIFTLSFHHVPQRFMRPAVDEAIRVLRPEGTIIFFEPGMRGSMFEAEIRFDAYDGDERMAKHHARVCMMNHPGLRLIEEIHDVSVFTFASTEDFMESMYPRREEEGVAGFLTQHAYQLDAERFISIFRAVAK